MLSAIMNVLAKGLECMTREELQAIRGAWVKSEFEEDFLDVIKLSGSN